MTRLRRGRHRRQAVAVPAARGPPSPGVGSCEDRLAFAAKHESRTVGAYAGMTRTIVALATLVAAAVAVAQTQEVAARWRERVPRAPREIPDAMWDRYARGVPEWLRDAKFGIYAHWGPYNLGMEDSGYTGGLNSWYAKFMYVKGHPYNLHHIRKFGPISQTGYSDYFQRFAIPKFDPAEWADLIAGAGARYGGPVAMHHDGFAMWDSELVPWNSKTAAAKRDISGDLISELRERGLRIVSSHHHAHSICGQYYGGRPDKPRDFPIDFDSELSDPKLAKLYGRFATQEDAEQYWLDVRKEYIAKYRPDQLWFDGGLRWLSEEILYELTKFYYDFCDREGIPGIISQKNDQIPRRVSVLDFERGGASGILPRVWQTDDSPGPWMYIKAMDFKGADWVIPLLVDIVSKNGVLLLNIAPSADGSIPDGQQRMLHEIGAWLRLNGEAIYGTRPWKVHHQGDQPRFYAEGRGRDAVFASFDSDDLRFTRSKDGRALYVFAMGLPDAEIVVRSLPVSDLEAGATAELLGTTGKVPVSTDAAGSASIPAAKLLTARKGSTGGPLVFKVTQLK